MRILTDREMDEINIMREEVQSILATADKMVDKMVDKLIISLDVDDDIKLCEGNYIDWMLDFIYNIPKEGEGCLDFRGYMSKYGCAITGIKFEDDNSK